MGTTRRYLPILPLFCTGVLLLGWGLRVPPRHDQEGSEPVVAPPLAQSKGQGSQTTASATGKNQGHGHCTPTASPRIDAAPDSSDYIQGQPRQGTGQAGEPTEFVYRVRPPALSCNGAPIHFESCNPGSVGRICIPGRQHDGRANRTAQIQQCREAFETHLGQHEGETRPGYGIVRMVRSAGTALLARPDGTYSCHRCQARRGPLPRHPRHAAIFGRPTFYVDGRTNSFGNAGYGTGLVTHARAGGTSPCCIPQGFWGSTPAGHGKHDNLVGSDFYLLPRYCCRSRLRGQFWRRHQSRGGTWLRLRSSYHSTTGHQMGEKTQHWGRCQIIQESPSGSASTGGALATHYNRDDSRGGAQDSIHLCYRRRSGASAGGTSTVHLRLLLSLVSALASTRRFRCAKWRGSRRRTGGRRRTERHLTFSRTRGRLRRGAAQSRGDMAGLAQCCCGKTRTAYASDVSCLAPNAAAFEKSTLSPASCASGSCTCSSCHSRRSTGPVQLRASNGTRVAFSGTASRTGGAFQGFLGSLGFLCTRSARDLVTTMPLRSPNGHGTSYQRSIVFRGAGTRLMNLLRLFQGVGWLCRVCRWGFYAVCNSCLLTLQNRLPVGLQATHPARKAEPVRLNNCRAVRTKVIGSRERHNSMSAKHCCKVLGFLWLLCFPTSHAVQLTAVASQLGTIVRDTEPVAATRDLSELMPLRDLQSTPAHLLTASPHTREVCVFDCQSAFTPMRYCADVRMQGLCLHNALCLALGRDRPTSRCLRLVSNLEGLASEQYVMFSTTQHWGDCSVPVDLRQLGGHISVHLFPNTVTGAHVVRTAMRHQGLTVSSQFRCRVGDVVTHPDAQVLLLPAGDSVVGIPWSEEPLARIPSSPDLHGYTRAHSRAVPAGPGTIAVLHSNGIFLQDVVEADISASSHTGILQAIGTTLRMHHPVFLAPQTLLPGLPGSQLVALEVEKIDNTVIVDLRDIGGSLSFAEVGTDAAPITCLYEAAVPRQDEALRNALPALLRSAALRITDSAALAPRPISPRGIRVISAGWQPGTRRHLDVVEEETATEDLLRPLPSAATRPRPLGVTLILGAMCLRRTRFSLAFSAILLGPILGSQGTQAVYTDSPPDDPPPCTIFRAADNLLSIALHHQYATLLHLQSPDALPPHHLVAGAKNFVDSVVCVQVWTPDQTHQFTLHVGDLRAQLQHSLRQVDPAGSRRPPALITPQFEWPCLQFVAPNRDPELVTILVDTGSRLTCLDVTRHRLAGDLFQQLRDRMGSEDFRVNRSLVASVRHGELIRVFSGPAPTSIDVGRISLPAQGSSSAAWLRQQRHNYCRGVPWDGPCRAGSRQSCRLCHPTSLSDIRG